MRGTVYAPLILVKKTKPDTTVSKQQREDSTGHPTMTVMRTLDSGGDRASSIAKSHHMTLNFQSVTSVLHQLNRGSSPTLPFQTAESQSTHVYIAIQCYIRAHDRVSDHMGWCWDFKKKKTYMCPHMRTHIGTRLYAHSSQYTCTYSMHTVTHRCIETHADVYIHVHIHTHKHVHNDTQEFNHLVTCTYIWAHVHRYHIWVHK